MKLHAKPIEEFFFDALLRICFVGVSVVMITDLYFTGFEPSRSLRIDSTILAALIIAFILQRYKLLTVAVILTATIIVSAMFYQSLVTNEITTSSMAVILVVGFGYSLLLKGILRVGMHGVTGFMMAVVFTWQAIHPQRYGKPDASDIIIMGVTYFTLYVVITYSSGILKQRYDEALKNLVQVNFELIEKSNEIETQNEELMLSQENLYQLNTHLESLVDERTHEVKKQNELLIKYAYANAHHVRGPVARVLGLIQLSKMETDLDYPFLFKKIEEQTKEIDKVVNSINRELGT